MPSDQCNESTGPVDATSDGAHSPELNYHGFLVSQLPAHLIDVYHPPSSIHALAQFQPLDRKNVSESFAINASLIELLLAIKFDLYVWFYFPFVNF